MLSCALATLVACEHYSVSLNDNQLYTPPSVLRVENIVDAHLADCLQQTFEDERITAAEQLLQLNCSSARITSLEGLQRYSRLQQLGLQNNELTDIEPLFELGNLEYINIENNPAIDCEQISRLATLVGSSSRFPYQCQPKLP
jgi:Leucine Rich repeats (2 copies)